ncbi:unnamed protein product [Amaranthus hypochondriacus]
MDLNEVPNDQTGLTETKIEEKIKGLIKNKGALEGVNSSELSLKEWNMESGDVRRLIIENKVLKYQRDKAIKEVEVWKQKCKELELRMAELKGLLKEDSSMNGASNGATLIEVNKAEKSCDEKINPVTPAKPKPLSAAVIDHIDCDEGDVHASHRSNPPSEGVSAMMPEEYGADQAGGITDGDEKSGGRENTASLTPMSKKMRDLMVVTSDDESEDYERKPIRRAIKIENSDTEDEDGNDITSARQVLGGVPSESDDDDPISLSRLKRKRAQVSRQPAAASNSNQPRRRLVKIGQAQMKNQAQEIENDDESSSESSLNSSNSFIVDDSDDEDMEDDELKEGGDDSYDQVESSDSDLDYTDIISKFRSRRNPDSKWIHEGDMLSDFGKNPVLCMKAVCALYRLQTNEEKACKISLFHNGRGFSRIDASSGTHLGEFLTDGDPKGDLVKSVEELKEHNRNGVEECRRLANHYSKQLFKIYESRDDPFFP